MTITVSRRTALRAAGLGVATWGASGWLPQIAPALATSETRKRQFILLWMAGGPSQLDTFDLKPEHINGGSFKPIATNVNGIQISEHLPQLSQQLDHLAIVRSLTSKEGDHGRGTYFARTGQRPMSVLNYPALPASVAYQLNDTNTGLPPYISIAPFRAFSQDAYGSGFLGPKYNPLIVENSAGSRPNGDSPNTFAELKVDAMSPPTHVGPARLQRRLQMWKRQEDRYLRDHPHGNALMHGEVYNAAIDLMNSPAGRVFDLSQEPAALRDKYGRGVFGQGCLLARRLIEEGVPCIEVSLGASADGVGWDTHADNFATVQRLSAELDAGWSSLLSDLHERGLLETTTILWMGEFGRTPKINNNAGRDHFPQAWTCVLGGGGIAGGQAYGQTTADGMEVDDRPVTVEQVMATVCRALGIAPDTMQMSDIGRPIPIVEAEPVNDLLS